MKSVKGFKAFNKGLVCRGFQYEEGKTYEEEKADLCNRGFHFCENPLDVLAFYDLTTSEFATVEAFGNVQGDGKKSVTTKIKIGEKLDLPGFIKASIDFVLEKCKRENDGDSSQLVASGNSSQLVASGNASQLAASGNSSKLVASGYASQLVASGNASQLAASGNSSKLVASGNASQLVASGYFSQLVASGYFSQLVASGNSSQLAASGYASKLVASGKCSKLAASGDSSKLAALGDSSKLAASGKYSKLAASGDSSQLELNGKYSVGACIGYDSKIKGKIGCWITLAEWKRDDSLEKWIPVCVRSAQIDGDILKEDVFYKLEKGEFVEADNAK